MATTSIDTVEEPGTRAASQPPRSFLGRVRLFLRQVIQELKKVTTPTRKELISYVGVVLVFVAIMMTLVAALDWAFGWAVLTVFGHPAS